jgi:hypothetical protein
MKMIVMIPPDLEKKILALAAKKGVDPSSLIVSLVKEDIEEEWGDLQSLDEANGYRQADDYDPDALKNAVERVTNRTPEQREAIRQELLKVIPEPLSIPEGKTVFDMFFRIRGDETEEQVYEALKRLS